MSWSDVLTLVTSVGFGVISALFPPANAETYVLASQVSAAAGAVPVAIGVAIGQTIGKVLLFLGVRRGRDFRFVRRRREEVRRTELGPTRRRVRRFLRWLLRLVGSSRWGLPITFAAALLGVPPLYPVALLAGATKMKLWRFAVAVLAGRTLRFVLVALGLPTLLPHSWFHHHLG